MSRKTIIIIAVIILVLFGVWIFIATRVPSSNTGTPANTSGSLFPFGNNTGTPSGQTTTPKTTGGQTIITPSGEVVEDPLVQISNKVVAGVTVLPPIVPVVVPPVTTKGATKTKTTTPSSTTPATKNTTSTPATTDATPAPVKKLPTVRFVERGTGYIYDVGARGGDTVKTSGTLVARTYTALFADNGNSVLYRYLKPDNKIISTFLGHILPPKDATSDGTVAGDFLPDNITDATISTDTKNIVFLLKTTSGSAGISMKSDGTSKKQLFSSPFSEWLLDWNQGGLMITTKANADTPGYLYNVFITGVFQKLLGGVNGLTTKMSPDGTEILYSSSGGGTFNLHIKNLKNGADINTGLQTFPEKCVWASDNATVYCGAGITVPQD